MAQQSPRPTRDQEPNGGNGSEPNFNWRGLLLFAAAILLIGGGFYLRSPNANSTALTYPKFHQALAEDRISKKKFTIVSEVGSPTDTAKGILLPSKDAPEGEPFRVQINPQYIQYLVPELEKHGIIPEMESGNNNVLVSALFNFLPVVLILLLLYFFFRQQLRMAGKGAMSFGKSKAKMMARDKNKVTFKDVAGVEEAKEEVTEIVEFLKDPKRFQKLGGRIPKGVLMVGPPGTGKTLLARAIAGEADVPFFSISGSDFVEMFVGVGASRVRDMFEQGKKAAPCLIFIDEIDAVGRHRGHGLGGGHDEREQTLNALLVEMDGFDTQDGVIIIAATNRPDVLDPALLRPGRFDRQVTVSLPDVKGREEILKVHAKKVKLAEDVNLDVIARGTPGFSGAELANLINEAALIAARLGLKAISNPQMEEARDKVRWGRERRSLAMSDEEKTSTAWHEAGHAMLSVLLEHTDPLHKVTIIPRGRSLGATMSLPEGDQYSLSRKEALDTLAMTAAGRIAEELFTHDLSTGASMDIKQMTRLAKKMVCEWGMSEKLGMVEYGDHEEHVFLGRDLGRDRAYSEATAQEIDREVKKLCDDAYNRALQLITANRDKVEIIAKALLEFETLDGEQVKDIATTGRMKNPPNPPTGGASKPLTPAPPIPMDTPASDAPKPGLDFPGGLSGAPA
jgi:cell division protease FtsH